ncbi:MAG: uncharacterized membrane protein YgaE (UPF0421/DUF939 family) [Bacillariaceae sp.]|jgi:hypothetical protein
MLSNLTKIALIVVGAAAAAAVVNYVLNPKGKAKRV